MHTYNYTSKAQSRIYPPLQDPKTASEQSQVPKNILIYHIALCLSSLPLSPLGCSGLWPQRFGIQLSIYPRPVRRLAPFQVYIVCDNSKLPLAWRKAY